MPTKSGRFSVVPSRAIDDQSLSRAAKLVLMTLGTYSDGEGWCWPKQETVAKRLATTRTKVNKYIAELAEHGYIEIKRGRYTNMYRIIYDSDVSVTGTSEVSDVTAMKTSGASDVPQTGTSDVPQTGTQNVPMEREESGGVVVLPDDFPNSRALSWAREAYPAIDVAAAARRFRLYHLAKSNHRRDWMDAWMRWMKTAWKDDHNDQARDKSPGNTIGERAARHAEAAVRVRERDPFGS